MASELPEALQSNFTSVLFGNSYSASLAFLVVSLCLAVPLLVFLSKHPPIMAQSTQSAQPSSKITETQLPIVASISHETAAPADPYIAHLPALEKQFLEFADTEAQPVSTGPDAKWVSVIEQKDGDYSISVQKSPSSDFFFRIVVDFESSAEETFDMIADINKRADWDEVTESSGIVQPISNKTSVNFMRTRGFWPTASRIALIMSFTRRLADGRYLNVTKSIDDHPDFTQQDGDVRMLAKIAGLVVGPHPSGKISMCRCVQVVDGDLGGWLPSSIVSLVTTQAFPISMRRVNKRLKKIILPRAVSALIRQAESSIAAPAPVLATAAAPLAISKPAGKSVKEKLSVIKKILLLLDKIQPFLVLYLFLAQVFRRRK